MALDFCVEGFADMFAGDDVGAVFVFGYVGGFAGYVGDFEKFGGDFAAAAGAANAVFHQGGDG